MMDIYALHDTFEKLIRADYMAIKEAETLLEKLEVEVENYGEEYSLLQIALKYEFFEKYDETIEQLKKAIEIAYANDNAFVIVQGSILLANLYVNQNKKNDPYEQKAFIEKYKSNKRLQEINRRIDEYGVRYKTAQIISEIGKQIVISDDLNSIFQLIRDEINFLMQCDAFTLGRIDDEKEVINFDFVYEKKGLLEPYVVNIADENKFSAWVARNKRSIKIDETLDEVLVKKYKSNNEKFVIGELMESIIICPVMVGNIIYGVISVQSVKKHCYSEHDLDILKILSVFIATAMKNWRENQMLEEMNKSLKELTNIGESINEINNQMLEIKDLDILLQKILEKAVGVLKYAEYGSVMYYRDDGYCEFKSTVGYDLSIMRDITFDSEDLFLFEKTEGRYDGAKIIDNVQTFNRESGITREVEQKLIKAGVVDIKTTISVPIFVDGKLYGFINLDSKVENAFNKESLLIAEIFVGKASQVIKNHLMLQEIIQLSQYDALTGVLNRRYFEEILKNSIQKGMRYKEQFLVVMFDLNGLKKVNDTYGHLAGDGLLSYFANYMKSNIRKADLFARYGGDEFVGVFYGTNVDDLEKYFEKATNYFSNNLYQYESNFIECSYSYGIAKFATEATSYDKLIEIADDRMYKYKRKLKYKNKR